MPPSITCPSGTPAKASVLGCASVFQRCTAQGGKIFESWQQPDREFLRQLLERFHDLACRGKLKLSTCCAHPRGHGGVKRALAEVDAALRSGEFNHVCRSDAKSYYASIRHDILLQQLARLPLPYGLQKAVAAYCRRTLCYGGIYATSSRGISQGGSLSPLLGASLSAATASRVKEVTAQVYDRTAREARQGSRKAPGQAVVPPATQAEFLRRVETLRFRWQRYLKGILAGFHLHLGATATRALYESLCAQHRHHSSSNHGLNHFPLPRWQGGTTTRQTILKTYVRKIQEDGLGGCCMHTAGC